MTIRFKCPHCQKPLSVKEHLAGKKAACPVCKKAITIPASIPPPVDVEAIAAEALADKPADKPAESTGGKPINFTCPFCDEELQLAAELAGKKTPCPKCTNIIKVPLPQDTKPRDWRTTQKGGPTAALANQPQQLDDAWGTEQKGKVSREAMEEAGALPEPEAKPVGVGGWFRRGFWTCLVGGALVLLFTTCNRVRVEKRERNHLEEAKKNLQKLAPLHQAEVYRAAGEIDVRNLKADDALTNFNVARSLTVPADAPAPPAAQDPAKTFANDRFLIKLVLSQAEMGGSGDETLKRGQLSQRFDWKDGIVQKDMLQTLEAMRLPEAKASALRALAVQLLPKDRLDVAMGLATNLATRAGQASPYLAQQIAMQLARNEEVDTSLIPAADAGRPIIDTLSRVAYTEGYALKKALPEAFKIASAQGPPAGRLEACVAGAAVALADSKNPGAAKDALPFIKEGVSACQELLKEDQDKAPSWSVLELIRLGGRTDAADDVKGLVDKLPAPFRPLAQLEYFQGQLDKNPAKPGDSSRVDDVGEGQRALAWEALARHNSRLGDTSSISVDSLEEFAPFIHLGFALGEKDRKK